MLYYFTHHSAPGFHGIENTATDLYWKDNHQKVPSEMSRDPELARRLWEKSCRLCAISDYFNPA